MNFVNINSDNNVPSINLKTIQIEQEPVRDIIITPVEVTLPENTEEKEGCIREECPVKVGCSDEFFAIKNLFSELTDDYQRAIIRQNLGIGGDNSLLWGKIEGNLANQKDLYKFITDTLRGDEEGILDKVNLELKYWTQYIENKIESLASNITSIEVIPRYATSNQLPVDVLVTWEYDQPVEAQTINRIVIDPEVRTYIFQDITDWEDDQYTIQDKIRVNTEEGEYIYVITKNQSDFSVNGIIGGFIQDSVIYIQSIRYYIYRSVNPGLGDTIVRIHDKE